MPRTWLAWHEWTRSSCIRSSTGGGARLIGHHPLPRGAGGLPHPAGQPRPGAVKSFGAGCPSAQPEASTTRRPSTSPRRSAGPRAHPGADRLPDTAHPRLRAPAGGDLQRATRRPSSCARSRGSDRLRRLPSCSPWRIPTASKRVARGAYLGLVPQRSVRG